MSINKINTIKRQCIANGIGYVLLIVGLVIAVVLLGVCIIGASHLAAFINYLRLN